jgi:hypothetical protein
MIATLDTSAFWTTLATYALAVAIWADKHVQPETNGYAALELRLGHPVQAGCRHPVQTLRRIIWRRLR